MQNRKRGTDVQNRLLGSVGEGEGGMFRENSIETCILSRVKQITSPGWMHILLHLSLSSAFQSGMADTTLSISQLAELVWEE